MGALLSQLYERLLALFQEKELELAVSPVLPPARCGAGALRRAGTAVHWKGLTLSGRERATGGRA